MLSKSLLIVFLLFSALGFSQSRQIITAALRDRSNFEIITVFGAKIPKKLVVLESPKKWDANTFGLDSIDLENPAIKMQMDNGAYKMYNDRYRNAYSDPYNLTYLFKDSLLKSKIGEAESLSLRKQALEQPINKIKFSGQNFNTAANYRQIKQAYFLTFSYPIFSSNNKYAFINFYIYERERTLETIDQGYFGDVTIVYEKQAKGNWKKIFCKAHNIL